MSVKSKLYYKYAHRLENLYFNFVKEKLNKVCPLCNQTCKGELLTNHLRFISLSCSNFIKCAGYLLVNKKFHPKYDKNQIKILKGLKFCKSAIINLDNHSVVFSKHVFKKGKI